MFRNYLNVALRSLSRNKVISFINITGLAVGMACATLIFLHVDKQLQYDKSQTKGENIYRLESQSWVLMPPYLRETASNFPEIEQSVRFFFWHEPTISHDEDVFTIKNFGLVDSTIFKVFNFNFISGNPERALMNPYSIVLTQSIATRLFGTSDAIGKSVKLEREFDYTVTGVIEDVEEFHMDINAFTSMTDLVVRNPESTFLTSRNNNHSIYLLLNTAADISDLTEKINKQALEADNYSGDPLILRPFSDIYFAQDLSHEKNTKHGNINLVMAFSIVGILILIIACVNFINLTVAKTGTREKEIAVRKVTGAKQQSIQIQFLGETVITVFFSLIIALNLVGLFLPSFNMLTGEELFFNQELIRIAYILTPILIFTILISGVYPSWYLSRINTTRIFKGKSSNGGKISTLSKILISFQYSISILLIIATITVIKQLRFMQNSSLGIDHEYVLTVKLRGDKFMGDSASVLGGKQAFQQRLSANPDFIGVTYLNQLPGEITNTYTMFMTSGETTNKDTIPVKVINADPDFVKLMDIEIIDGRNLSYDLRSDLGSKFLINEEAAKQYGIINPVGSELQNMEIVGVVKDFHFNSMHTRIEPVAIVWDWWTSRACIKLSDQNLKESIQYVNAVYDEFCPGFGFEYEFLDESFAKQYEAEERLESILIYFVSLAILLSCLGLFALTTLISEQKTKEIGIRKVLGSSNQAIIFLLTNTFTKWIILANILSWPIAYVILSIWLTNFEYRISMGISIFIQSGILTFLIAFSTTAIQALKSVFVNPVDSLRYE